MNTPLFQIRALDVRFETSHGDVHAVRSFNFEIHSAQTVAIVGESGSGKSQAMLAALGLQASNGRATGSVRFDGEDILGRPADQMNRVRGPRIGMIFQEPMTSLDPLVTIGRQIAAPLVHHQRLSLKAALARAVALLADVEFRDPERRLDAYPHELSGGQRQRVMIAMALANNPALLIADEPTTALDVTIQARILTMLARLKQQYGLAMVFITHDLRLVRRLADRVVVMRHGTIVEEADTPTLFARPKHDYTRMLIDAEPTGRKRATDADAPVVLDAQNIRVAFPGGGWGKRSQVMAVDDVTLRIHRGETVGIAGESGCGKTTLGRAVLRLVPASGRIALEDRHLEALDTASLRPLRRRMQMVFQDPYGSLSPRMTAGEIVTEGLLAHEPGITRAARDTRAALAFEDVQLDPATRHRFPHEFSGGQRQRIAIARAMLLKPQLVVLDEPTSALDRSVQKEIIELLRRLQQAHGLAYLFISHDLRVIQALADRVVVMRSGRVVEQGSVDAILRTPREGYTQELVQAAML